MTALPVPLFSLGNVYFFPGSHPHNTLLLPGLALARTWGQEVFGAGKGFCVDMRWLGYGETEAGVGRWSGRSPHLGRSGKMKIIEVTVGTHDDNQVVVPPRPGRWEECPLGFL